MYTIKFDDRAYELYDNSIEVTDVLTAIVRMGDKTFDEICKDVVCERVQVVDEEGTILNNYYGFNNIASATLIKDKIITTDRETGEAIIEDVVQVVLMKASVYNRLADLEETVDFLAEEIL